MRYSKGDFTQVPNKSVLRGLDPMAQVLFMWFCSYADEDGCCFPSIEALANDCGMSTDSVIRHTKVLCEFGLLQKEPRHQEGRQTSNIYQIILREPPVRGIVGSHIATPEGRTERLPRVAQSDTNYIHSNDTHINSDAPAELSQRPAYPKPSKKAPDPIEDEDEVEIVVDEDMRRHSFSKFPDAKKVFALFPRQSKFWAVNAPIRASAQRLYEMEGLEKLKRIMAFYNENKDNEYCPIINSPKDLEEKLASLRSFRDKINK